jgi:hypothetical protein
MHVIFSNTHRRRMPRRRNVTKAKPEKNNITRKGKIAKTKVAVVTG